MFVDDGKSPATEKRSDRNETSLLDDDFFEQLRSSFTKTKTKLSQNQRPSKDSENYIRELLIFKDKIFREMNGLSRIHSNDPSQYCSILIDNIQNVNNIEMKDGFKCSKCGKLSAFRTAEQRRCGDEGQSMIIKCSIKSCGFTKLLSH